MAAGLASVLLVPTSADAQVANGPPAARPDVAAVAAGGSVRVAVLTNDADPDGDPIGLVGATLATPGAGAVAVAGNAVVFTAAARFAGPAQVRYVVTDDLGAQAAGLLTVTVRAAVANRPPVAAPDAARATVGQPIALDVLANDRDPDGEPLTLVGATLTPAGSGTVTASGRVLTIVAARPGTLRVVYVVADARGARAQGVASIAVAPQAPPPPAVSPRPANAPPVARPDTFEAKAGRRYRINVKANDSDPEGKKLRLVRVGKAGHGKAKKSGQRVRYRAPKGFTGTDTIAYAIRDRAGAVTWGKLTVIVRAPASRPAPPAKPPQTQPPQVKPGGQPSRLAVEKALARLGMPVGAANGRYDSKTRRAACAWRTALGRGASRRLPSAAEARAIVATSSLPRAARGMVVGVNVSRKCQAAFWVSSSHSYRRVMAATTGKPGFRTRVGTFRIFRTHRTWRWSTVYPEARMYKPMQFSGGQALHGSSTDRLVKSYPASHGCVRMLHRDIDALHRGGVGNGTRVRVFGTW